MVGQLGLEPKPLVQCSVLHQPTLQVAMGSGLLQGTKYGGCPILFNFQQRALWSLTIISAWDRIALGSTALFVLFSDAGF